MNSAYEFKALQARVAWASPAFIWAVAFALRGPWWLPVALRRVPLACWVGLARIEAWGVRHGL